jgi:hypothetical protein
MGMTPPESPDIFTWGEFGSIVTTTSVFCATLRIEEQASIETPPVALK